MMPFIQILDFQTDEYVQFNLTHIEKYLHIYWRVEKYDDSTGVISYDEVGVRICTIEDFRGDEATFKRFKPRTTVCPEDANKL